jgi:hypothetical protein
VFDVTKLTLDEIGAEIDKTLNKLERLQALYSAVQAQDHRRIQQLVKEYQQAKAEADEELREQHDAEAHQGMLTHHGEALLHGDKPVPSGTV